VTNRIADLGTLQLITTGSGSEEGFGAATVVVSITQDRAVTPCGQGSWTNAATRRISLGGDFLAREVVVSRPERTGVSRDLAPILGGTVIFAGATGSGTGRLNLAPAPIVTAPGTITFP